MCCAHQFTRTNSPTHACSCTTRMDWPIERVIYSLNWNDLSSPTCLQTSHPPCCKYTTCCSGQSSGAHKKVIIIWSLPNTLPCWVRSPAPPLRRDFGNRSGKEFETFLGRLGWITSNSQWGSNLQSFDHALPTELSLINQHHGQWWLSYLYPRVMGESQTCQPKFFKMCD